MKMEIEMSGIADFSVNPIEDEIALLKHRIHKLLQTNKVEVNFTKMDGTNRKMICTLDSTLIPKDITFSEEHRKVSDDVLAVWDLEKDDWRSFRLDHVNSFMAVRSEV